MLLTLTENAAAGDSESEYLVGCDFFDASLLQTCLHVGGRVLIDRSGRLSNNESAEAIFLTIKRCLANTVIIGKAHAIQLRYVLRSQVFKELWCTEARISVKIWLICLTNNGVCISGLAE